MKYKLLFITLMLVIQPIYHFNAEELSEASITIVNSNENQELVSGVKIELYDSNDILVDSGVSNTEGEVLFENIPLGTYTAKVTGVPLVYQTYNTQYKINVTNTRQNYLINNELTYKEYDTIIFYKMDSNGNPLSGSELTIYDENNNVVQDIYTDENGFAESEPLEKGLYYIQETKAPRGYNLDPNRYTIYVGSNVRSLEYTSVSEPITGSKIIDVLNVNGNVLAGVNFNLIDATGNQVSLSSDNNGNLSIKQLAIGDYTLQLDDSRFSGDIQEYGFSVSTTGTISNLPSQIYLTPVMTVAPTVVNSVIPIAPTVNKLATTGEVSYLLLFAIVLLVLIGVKKARG